MSQEDKGKVYVITGANTGIGKVTALELAKRGGRILMACRSEQKALPVVEEVQKESGNSDVHFIKLDLASLSSVKTCASHILDTEERLDVLINNAGVASIRGETQEGFELAFGVNHLGHFLFTQLLLPLLKKSTPSRVVTVASKAHYSVKGALNLDAVKGATDTYVGLKEYEVSKLCNILFTKELAKRLEGSGVTCYALHPGVVASDIWRRIPGIIRPLAKMFMISNEEGAKTTLYCATSPDVAGESGLYYDECKQKKPSKLARDEALASELWRRSEEWVADFV
ncbi:MAG: SDR family oxidoreductase [Deltaproteobacteria bacterium]|nr:SDR family oxidoreductase [Deltaproteobacteria bacterium]MBU53006.1 SDR family oxidoreductase [Deltaproteobacteria bacterium]|tara:strand:+ start:5859 stop:6710 length:852 start_codon:yes stop_codon:yes gene_type:complete